MNERHLQDRFLLPFLVAELGYHEVKANTVSPSLIIEEDLHAFISDTPLNRQAYQTLLRKYDGDSQKLLQALIDLIEERSGRSRNMALFFHGNQSVTLNGVQLHLFYPSDSVLHGDTLFHHNHFAVVQEFPFRFQHEGRTLFHFRPDVAFFLNGLFIGYSELKANFSNQTARKDGRKKVIADYINAVGIYYDQFEQNEMLSEAEKTMVRKQLLKPFERAIHISSTDLGETFFIRNIATFFAPLLDAYKAGRFDRGQQAANIEAVFKPYPLHTPDAPKKEKLKEIFRAHYGKLFIEKEILYYNFIEREMIQNGSAKAGRGSGRLIAPRPKQKFGTDKIIAKIDEFLAHEGDDAYYERQLEQQLAHISEKKRKALIEKRKRYHNNKNVYSLLMQYAAGFGKSNIIGWTALQLKDLQRDGAYVYDKILLVVDRIQLRDQLDSKLLNMNIENALFVEARNRNTFEAALAGDMRIIIVNLQKFGSSLRELLGPEVLKKLANQRVVFLIDEIHRSQGGDQHNEMVNIFDELQTVFDADDAYNRARRKKNLIVGFTATPSDKSLVRFGEFGSYAENQPLWVPFDAYTMQEAIDDGYIHNPIENIVPVASKMIFDLPRNRLAGFKEPNYKDVDKKQIYENRDRINAISAYVADLLVNDVYRQIKGKGKAMLAVYSIPAAVEYHQHIQAHFEALLSLPKYKRYAEAPIFVVYSERQGVPNPNTLNGGMTESKVLDAFARAKNGLIIVVDKLQTGFDERNLHTLFLDKEVRGINAIQTISRVNRTTKDKVDCKIVDFSYNNVNVQHLKDAFAHFSNVVVSDDDPLGEAKLLDMLYGWLKESTVFERFFHTYILLMQDEAEVDFWDLESDFERYITSAADDAANTKAKAAQYFTILNRIEYVITIDKKFSDPHFLDFWRKFNTIYNRLKPNHEEKDPIEVYFDNQIGIIEVETADSPTKKKRELKLAEAQAAFGNGRQLAILEIIEARNENEANKAALIAEFQAKMEAFFTYVKASNEGRRLIVKIKSGEPEEQLIDEFEKIYTRYKIVKRREVGEYFFKEAGSLLNQLYALFERSVQEEAS